MTARASEGARRRWAETDEAARKANVAAALNASTEARERRARLDVLAAEVTRRAREAVK